MASFSNSAPKFLGKNEDGKSVKNLISVLQDTDDEGSDNFFPPLSFLSSGFSKLSGSVNAISNRLSSSLSETIPLEGMVEKLSFIPNKLLTFVDSGISSIHSYITTESSQQAEIYRQKMDSFIEHLYENPLLILDNPSILLPVQFQQFANEHDFYYTSIPHRHALLSEYPQLVFIQQSVFETDSGIIPDIFWSRFSFYFWIWNSSPDFISGAIEERESDATFNGTFPESKLESLSDNMDEWAGFSYNQLSVSEVNSGKIDPFDTCIKSYVPDEVSSVINIASNDEFTSKTSKNLNKLSSDISVDTIKNINGGKNAFEDSLDEEIKIFGDKNNYCHNSNQESIFSSTNLNMDTSKDPLSQAISEEKFTTNNPHEFKNKDGEKIALKRNESCVDEVNVSCISELKEKKSSSNHTLLLQKSKTDLSHLVMQTEDNLDAPHSSKQIGTKLDSAHVSIAQNEELGSALLIFDEIGSDSFLNHAETEGNNEEKSYCFSDSNTGKSQCSLTNFSNAFESLSITSTQQFLVGDQLSESNDENDVFHSDGSSVFDDFSGTCDEFSDN